MAKYESLAGLLASLESERVTLSSTDIDLLVDELPWSARADSTWWGNRRTKRECRRARLDGCWLACGASQPNC
jgi:hypothetical protein